MMLFIFIFFSLTSIYLGGDEEDEEKKKILFSRSVLYTSLDVVSGFFFVLRVVSTIYTIMSGSFFVDSFHNRLLIIMGI